MQPTLSMGAWALYLEMKERDIRVRGNPESRGVFCVVPGPNTERLSLLAPRTASPDLPRAMDCKALIGAGLLEPTTPEMPENQNRYRCYKLSMLGERIAQGELA